MSDRPLHPLNRWTPAATAIVASFHADTVAEVAAAVAREKVVVVGMAWNPHCRWACAALRAADVPFTYLEYGNYVVGWKKRLAIKMWTGWPTFPQVFVRGTFIGGNTELTPMIADGTFKQLLDAAAQAH